MPGEMRPPTVATTIAFGMYVAGARHDATEEQYRALRAEILPRLEEYRVTGDGKPIVAAIKQTMAPEWAPSGEYAIAMDVLMSLGADTPGGNEQSTEGSRK